LAEVEVLAEVLTEYSRSGSQAVPIGVVEVPAIVHCREEISMESDLRARIESEIESELDSLRAARDELRVQIHLGAAEAREAWEKTEKGWNHLEGRLKVLGEATQESLEDIGGAVEMLADEIRRGYKHVRKLL
jgi:hypothetical protein